MAPRENCDIVRDFWHATRARDSAAAIALVSDDVRWHLILTDAEPIRGREALAVHFEGIVAGGLVADAQLLSCEEPVPDRVLANGAVRLRRADNWVTTVQRWWLYDLRDGLITRARGFEDEDAAREAAAAPPRPLT